MTTLLCRLFHREGLLKRDIRIEVLQSSSLSVSKSLYVPTMYFQLRLRQKDGGGALRWCYVSVI